MHHSNIAMYIESFIEGSRLYIVMEHADGGDLSGAITRRKEGGKLSMNFSPPDGIRCIA